LILASFCSLTVSIHAPAQGATHGVHRAEGLKGVSIHAPAQGATVVKVERTAVIGCFNPRPRAGGDWSPW